MSHGRCISDVESMCSKDFSIKTNAKETLFGAGSPAFHFKNNRNNLPRNKSTHFPINQIHLKLKTDEKESETEQSRSLTPVP